MTSERSICSLLNQAPVTAVAQQQNCKLEELAIEYDRGHDTIVSGCEGYKAQWNNLSLGSLDFKWVPSQLIDTGINQTPQIGDVCCRLMPLMALSDDFTSIVDLYNTYIAKGSPLIAKMCIQRYSGTNELYIPAIPIQVLVSEWNKSLKHFQELIRSSGTVQDFKTQDNRKTVISNVTQIALKNVPIVSDHLWFVIHSLVSNPRLIMQVIQLLGAIVSSSGALYHTGEVENTTVPLRDHHAHLQKLYLVAKPVPENECNVTALGDKAGVTLALIWVSEDEDLHEQLKNAGNCSYAHIGTESGNSFRSNGFLQWHYFNHQVFSRMVIIGQKTAPQFTSLGLAGNTGDSARLLTWD